MRTSLAAISQADQTWHVRPEDPFATTDRLPEGIDPDQVSRFGDPRWNYTVLSRRRSEGSKTVNWAAFPETLRESFRRAGWALVNLPTPAALLNRAATARVEWPAPGTMAQVFLGWRRFAVWLADHSVTSLPEVDHDLLADYAAHIGRRGLLERRRAGRPQRGHAVVGIRPTSAGHGPNPYAALGKRRCQALPRHRYNTEREHHGGHPPGGDVTAAGLVSAFP